MKPAALALGAACMAAGLAGYWLAHHPGRFPDHSAEGRTIPPPPAGHRHFETGVDSFSATPRPTMRTARQLAALKADLLQRFATSTSPGCDWALRGQARALLATFTTDELREFAGELIARQGSSPQVTASLPAIDVPLLEIFSQWGLRDPEAACLGLGGSALAWRQRVFDQWCRRDPAAAGTWLDSAPFPVGREKEDTRFRQDLLNLQMAADFPTACESLTKLAPDAQQTTLFEWTWRVARDPSKRDELLAMVEARGDSEFTRKCYQRLVWEISAHAPEEAAEFLENARLPDDQKQEIGKLLKGG